MKKHYTNLTMLIFALSVTTAVTLLYVYMYKQVNASFTRALAAQNIESSQREDNLQAQNLLELHKKTAEQRSRLMPLFIKDSQAVEFIENLENIGTKVGSKVVLSAVNSEDSSTLPAGSFSQINAHVAVSGSWAAVMRTLMLSEILPYQASIDKISLHSSPVEAVPAPGPVTGTAGTRSVDKPVKHDWQLSYNISATVVVGSTNP